MNSFLNPQGLNPFEAHGAAQLSTKARDKRIAKLVVNSERDAPMVPSPSEKAIRETQNQYAQYEKTLRAEKKAFTESGKFNALLGILDHLSFDSATVLINHVQATDWQQFSVDERHTALSIIDGAIMRLRIREGLAPFDDGAPYEPPTVFCIVRHLITGAPL
jgi:hypothetical protein